MNAQVNIAADVTLAQLAFEQEERRHFVASGHRSHLVSRGRVTNKHATVIVVDVRRCVDDVTLGVRQRTMTGGETVES